MSDHEPVCPPESRCLICYEDDDAVIKALVADRDRLQVVFDEACKEVKLSHGDPCFCKYCWEPSEAAPGGGSATDRLVARGVATGQIRKSWPHTTGTSMAIPTISLAGQVTDKP